MGLAAYANLLRNANRSDEAGHYELLNKQFVEYWLKYARVSTNTCTALKVHAYDDTKCSSYTTSIYTPDTLHPV